MAFKFYLDGVEVTEPKGWDDAEITIERDDEIRGLLYAYTSKLTFFDDGYDAIKTAFDDGFCNNLDVLIEYECSNGFSTFFEGLLFITECIIDCDKCQVECEINDNHYGAKIKNNKKIKAFVDVGRSKNDTVITACPQTTVEMFTPSNGVTHGTAREAYKLYDLFTFFIAFMTDGAITFDSVYFGTGGDGEDYVVTTGAAIRDTSEAHPLYINFNDLFRETHIKFNITFYMDVSGATPKMWIEPTEDVYDTSETISITDVPGITVEVDDSRLYSIVQMGGTTTQDDDITFQFPDGNFFGHKKEEYHVLGECNIDNELDLIGDWVVDSNVIEDIIVNAVDDYDDEVFMIETDGAGNAVESEIFVVPPATVPKVYNPSLVNSAVADRFFGGVHNSIALFLGDGDDGFEAEKLTQENHTFVPPATISSIPLEMSTEISDPNANYTAASSYYTAPQSGSYTFDAGAYLFNFSFSGGSTIEGLNANLRMDRYEDNTFANLMEFKQIAVDFYVDPPFTSYLNRDVTDPNLDNLVQLTKTFYLNTGNVLRLRLVISETGDNTATEIDVSVADTQSYFKTSAIYNGGGIWQTYDPKAYRALLYKFNYPLKYDDFAALLPNNKQKVNFEKDTGWIKRLIYKQRTGLGQWDIITT